MIIFSGSRNSLPNKAFKPVTRLCMSWVKRLIRSDVPSLVKVAVTRLPSTARGTAPISTSGGSPRYSGSPVMASVHISAWSRARSTAARAAASSWYTIAYWSTWARPALPNPQAPASAPGSTAVGGPSSGRLVPAHSHTWVHGTLTWSPSAV